MGTSIGVDYIRTMITRKIRVLLGLLLGLHPLFAQEPALRIRRFEDTPELANVGINDILQDKTGFIWIGTDGGLFRYDGHSFKTFRHVPGDSTSIGSNSIFCMEEDANGDIWIGRARGGASRYDHQTGHFHNYPFTLQLDPSTTTVTGIFHDKDNQVWAGIVEKGVAKLDPKTGKFECFDVVTHQSSPLLSPLGINWANQPYHFWQNPADGMLWMTTRDGIYRLNPATGQSQPLRDPKSVYDDKQKHNTWTFLEDGDLLWTGGWESGLQSFHKKTGEIRQYLYHPNPPNDLITNIVNGIAHKNQDELWVATGYRGLAVFNKKTGQFRFFDHAEDNLATLSKGTIRYLMADRQGNLWVELNGVLTHVIIEKGLFTFEKTQSNGVNRAVSELFEDREGRFLFTGTHGGDGLWVLDKKTNKRTVLAYNNPPGVTKLMAIHNVRQAPNGTIWVLARHTLLQFDPVKMRLVPPAVPPVVYGTDEPTNAYTECAIDPQGRIWMGTSSSGIIRYNPATGETTHFMPNPNDPNSLPTHVIGVIAMDKQGRCWYGSRDKTCYGYYLERENRFVRLDTEAKPTQSRASQRTNSIFVDRRGDIWVSTESGLLHLDGSGDTPVLIKKYTLSDGMPSDYAVRTTDDANGRIWGFARRQLYSVDPATQRIQVYGKRDGFDFLEAFGIYSAQNGRIYVYGEYKITHFDPNTLQPVRPEARLTLTSFRINDQEHYQGSASEPPQLLVIPADSRHFSFEFSTLDMVHSESHKYEYYFEGFDNQWVKSGTRRTFGFTNIPPGHYTFRIKLEGAPDSEALSIPLHIDVVFYKTNWFWLLVAAVLAVLLWRFFQNRRQQERQMQELKSKTQLLEKEKAVVMYESLKQQLNPHFLFNSLTSLGSLIQIDPRSAASFLDNLSKTYRYILKSSEYEVVLLSDEIKFAESFVRLQKTRFENGLEVHFDVMDDYLQRRIVPVTLQNLIENAIKHNIIDEETPLVVDIFAENDYLVVRNNLQKKKFVDTSNRKGLLHLQSFYRYLSDRSIIITEEEDHFTVKIPLL